MSKIQNQDQFTTACKNAAVVWFNKQKYVDNDGALVLVAHDDVKTVWNVKCLANYKAIMSILSQDWGIPNILFEFSYNGSKNELYMDVYQKVYNECFNVVA